MHVAPFLQGFDAQSSVSEKEQMFRLEYVYALKKAYRFDIDKHKNRIDVWLGPSVGP